MSLKEEVDRLTASGIQVSIKGGCGGRDPWVVVLSDGHSSSGSSCNTSLAAALDSAQNALRKAQWRELMDAKWTEAAMRRYEREPILLCGIVGPGNGVTPEMIELFKKGKLR